MPLAAIERSRAFITWSFFVLTNVLLYGFVIAIVFVEWKQNNGEVGSMFWSADVVDGLLILIAMSYTSTALRMYQRISAHPIVFFFFFIL